VEKKMVYIFLVFNNAVSEKFYLVFAVASWYTKPTCLRWGEAATTTTTAAKGNSCEEG